MRSNGGVVVRLVCCLLFACTFACEDEVSSEPACTANVECALPLQCINGRCLEECRDTIDCAAGAVCYMSTCRERPPICATDEECIAFGEVCDRVRNRCVPPGAQRCDDDIAPCPAGERCMDGICGLPVPDSGRRADAARPDAGEMSDMRPRPDAGPVVDQGQVDQMVPPDGGPDCPEGDGAYGTPCIRGTDCASGFCVENKLRGARLCTCLCDLDAPSPNASCPGIDVCVPAEAQGGNPACPPRPDAPQPGEIVGVCVGNESGLPCDFDDPAPGSCLGGTCLRPPNPLPWTHVQDVCATQCTADAECPTGTHCRDVPPVGRICAPLVEGLISCQQPEQCAGQCPAGLGEGCLQPDQRGAGYCVCFCRSVADCPAGHACQPDPGGSKICIPFAGYRCPEELLDPPACQNDQSCQAGEACVSGRCQYIQCPSLTCLIDDADPRLNQCSAGCVNNGDCPTGYQCQNFQGVGGFCVPE